MMAAALKIKGPEALERLPSRVQTEPLKGSKMNAYSYITADAVPATALKRDYHGDLMDALSIMQCAYVIIDAGYEAEGSSKEFQTFHEINLLLTCILDRVEADTEMLDRLETHLQNKTGGRNET